MYADDDLFLSLVSLVDSSTVRRMHEVKTKEFLNGIEGAYSPSASIRMLLPSAGR
jgi:hypothetical protein